MQKKTLVTLAASCLALTLATAGYANEHGGHGGGGGQESHSSASTESEHSHDSSTTQSHESGQHTSQQTTTAPDAAPLVDSNGQAVDADGNAIILEDLLAPLSAPITSSSATVPLTVAELLSL